MPFELSAAKTVPLWLQGERYRLLFQENNMVEKAEAPIFSNYALLFSLISA
jgi:hypothetical protein